MTNHVTANLNNLSIKSEYLGNDKIFVGNDDQLAISHIGDTKVKSHCMPHSYLELKHVLCAFNY